MVSLLFLQTHQSVTGVSTKNQLLSIHTIKKSHFWKACLLQTTRNIYSNVPCSHLCFLGGGGQKEGDIAWLNHKSTIFQLSNKASGRSHVIKLKIDSLSQIYYYSEGQSYSYGEFKNRITAATSPGNASITISNMQPSDTGSYTCEVFSPQGDAGQSQKSVIVNVLGKRLSSLSLHCGLLPLLWNIEFTAENTQDQRE